MTDTDSDLRDRLVAMESRLETTEPPALPTRPGRRLALSFAAGPLLVLAVVATAAAGIVAAGQVRGYPGVENPGQPLAGAQLECMTPPQAAAYIAAHGIKTVVWQVERDAPGATVDGKPRTTSTQQPAPPETGFVVAGAIVDGTLLMIADQREGATGTGACAAH